MTFLPEDNMLEFQDDFFKPEIRSGFFVDATMKTLWAAELEVLNTVAEICARHNLTWYAGYGTLLGAIRHEGFIPWDDDMDIMMLRPDYMKLMEILPKELPAGYRFRSPFSEEGFTEYHTNIINGDGVCITQEFLQKFHNCPFTVGLDIFPLDYLTRNKSEREIQKSLFTMAGRITQLAKNLKGSFEPEANDRGKGKEEFIQEIKEGMKRLEDCCAVKMDYEPVEKEDWDAVMTQAWKLANQIAMIYSRHDGEDIVMYGDYITWERKIYSKSIFREVYSASYEQVMLPIPCGYDEFLRIVYGNYMMPRKNAGMHEYPFYARQLRDLKEYVWNVEKKLDPKGHAERPDPVFPADWKQLVDGKKIVFFNDGIQFYVEHGEAALEKLDSVMDCFRENQDKVVIWWRPQSQIRVALGLLGQELVEKYDAIVERFRKEAWGVYDISERDDRAEQICDAYYGEMNAVVNRLKGKKPVMIEGLV